MHINNIYAFELKLSFCRAKLLFMEVYMKFALLFDMYGLLCLAICKKKVGSLFILIMFCKEIS